MFKNSVIRVLLASMAVTGLTTLSYAQEDQPEEIVSSVVQIGQLNPLMHKGLNINRT